MRPIVLVVQQESRSGEDLSGWLRDAGYEVREARDAHAASRRLAALTPDLLVLDAGTPYRSGIGFVAEILADVTLPLVPLLVVTSDGALAAHAEDLGADFLPRPFAKEALLRAVERNLRAARREEPALGYECALPALRMQHGTA